MNFFRTRIEGDLSALTLPRTFFGRSEVNGARFCNSDLRESNLCWNDFVDVDFGQAILRDADLRASVFERVSFVGADLAGADLRQSTFENCAFDRASMEGAVLTKLQGTALSLSASQRSQINWTDDEGDEPEGG